MDLNNDVVTAILVRLPVQSVLRFRSVCKSWRSIIDSSTFAESHLQNHKGDTMFLRYEKWSPYEFSILNADNGNSHRSFPAFHEFVNDNFRRRSFVFVGPVNGLMCMYDNSGHSKAIASWGQSTAIYNPCLDKIKVVPVSPFCSSIDYMFRVVGFGFNHATKDYKLVQLTFFGDGHMPTCVEVYSGKSNTWRKLITDFPVDDYDAFLGINSTSSSWAHWRTIRHGYDPPNFVILSFSMQNEVFEAILGPNFLGRAAGVTSLYAKDDDSFALFVLSSCDVIEVWELERRDKERGWTHVTNIIANDVPLMRRPMGLLFPKALWKRDGVLLIGDDIEQTNLILYDYSTGKVRECFGMPGEYRKTLEYMGSLISP